MSRQINWTEFDAVVRTIGQGCGVEARLDLGSNEESITIHIQEAIEREGRPYLLSYAVVIDCCAEPELVQPIKRAILDAKPIARKDMSAWGSEGQ